MSDNKSNAGQQDRVRVSASEDYEVRTIAQKFGLEMEAARAAIQQHGPMRKDIEAALQNRQKN